MLVSPTLLRSSCFQAHSLFGFNRGNQPVHSLWASKQLHPTPINSCLYYKYLVFVCAYSARASSKMGFFDKLNAKLELFKLEQRYTRRKRRTTFISDAIYVDGEYVYADGSKVSSPVSTKSNYNWAPSSYSGRPSNN